MGFKFASENVKEWRLNRKEVKNVSE